MHALSTLSNMNISETKGPIEIKFYQKHHWGGGKARDIKIHYIEADLSV